MRVAYTNETCLDDAILVVLEVFDRRIVTLALGVRKVVFNQGAYNTFVGHALERARSHYSYRHPGVEAAIVVPKIARRIFLHLSAISFGGSSHNDLPK
jgi:hypothetical protein